MALNWFYIAGLSREAARQSVVTVFDQGVLQALWSVAYGNDALQSMSIDEWASRAGERLPPGSVAVFVDADEPTLRARLATRDESQGRIDAAMAGSEQEFDLAIEKGFAALDFVERAAGHLQREGRLRIERVDSGSSDPESLARQLVEILYQGDEW
jgi:hypothetical protein